MEALLRAHKKTLRGIVTSNKMQKSVSVLVTTIIKHPRFKKYVKRHKKFMAHDEKGCGIGDTVLITESRPLSKLKRWIVTNITKKATLIEDEL
jgi:small subunit ribosomal protein S17